MPAARRSRAESLVAALGVFLLFCGFIALGTWQLERRVWKLALIARVEAGIKASPVAAPPPANWPQVTRNHDEYRRVTVTGRYQPEAATWVQAVTDLGAGYWVLTPLRREDGSQVLVNRGFVSQDLRDSALDAPLGTVTITGLLRMSEPGGAFLRHNLPESNRWYSRDVRAIAQARHLGDVAPYFIDADHRSEPGSSGSPVGGLTVIAFHNNHLMYAITWYTLALLCAGALGYGLRQERRSLAALRDP